VNAQVNSEQSDAEADPSLEGGRAHARVDSSDEETTDEARYFDARELQRPSMTLPEDLDACSLAASGERSGRAPAARGLARAAGLSASVALVPALHCLHSHDLVSM
jgi:hypothetical protein